MFIHKFKMQQDSISESEAIDLDMFSQPLLATDAAVDQTNFPPIDNVPKAPALAFLSRQAHSAPHLRPRAQSVSAIELLRGRITKRNLTAASDQEGEELVAPLPPSTELKDKEVTPLVHLYRAEVGRLVGYRQRLDTTTNWAVSITSALVAFSLGSPSTPHYFFAFIVVMQLIFCIMEARRHVNYNLVRHRCRLMERGMYAHILEPSLPAANWRSPLRTSYLENAKLLPLHRAFLTRIKRNYVFLIMAAYLGWAFKLLSDEGVFLWEFFIPVSLVEIPFTLYILFFYKDQSIDV